MEKVEIVMNIGWRLTTNGSYINENMIEFVKKYMNNIDVSLDYHNKEDNDFRGSENAWD